MRNGSRIHLTVSVFLSSHSAGNSANKTEEKVGEGKFSRHSLDEVAGMIRQTLSIYEAKVHGTFQELEESSILHPYMNDCIKEISKACQALGGKESAPVVGSVSIQGSRLILGRGDNYKINSSRMSNTVYAMRFDFWNREKLSHGILRREKRELPVEQHC